MIGIQSHAPALFDAMRVSWFHTGSHKKPLFCLWKTNCKDIDKFRDKLIPEQQSAPLQITVTQNVCFITKNSYLIIVLLAVFQSDVDKKFQTRSREQIGAVKKCKGFGCSFGCNFGCIGVVLSQHLANLRTKKLSSLFHDLFPYNEVTHEAHRISKRSMASLDILITLTLYKLGRYFQAQNSVRVIEFTFRRSRGTYKNALFGRNFELWNWECVWNPASDAKTRSRECTYHDLTV